MQNTKKFYQIEKLRFLAFVPVIAILFLGISCSTGHEKANAVTAVELTKMNVIYLGVENPLKIASSGYKASELEVTLDNGTISGSNGEYVISPKEAGLATLLISCNGKEIQKAVFRVKVVPDPVASVRTLKGELPVYVTGDPISKKDLLNAGGISVEMKNFDFDINFKIVSFDLSGTFNQYEEQQSSKSDRFTEKQIALFERMINGQKLYISNIIAIGPDGMERKLNEIFFRISEE